MLKCVYSVILGCRFAAVTKLFLKQLSLKVGIEWMEAVRRQALLAYRALHAN